MAFLGPPEKKRKRRKNPVSFKCPNNGRSRENKQVFVPDSCPENFGRQRGIFLSASHQRIFRIFGVTRSSKYKRKKYLKFTRCDSSHFVCVCVCVKTYSCPFFVPASSSPPPPRRRSGSKGPSLEVRMSLHLDKAVLHAKKRTLETE